jgi:hypothetical protein
MNRIAFIITLCFCHMATHSQDVIIKTNGEEIKAKIIEVQQTEVKYKQHDNLDGPLFSITKSEVLLIKYENGSKDVFPKDFNSMLKEKEKTDEQTKAKARIDAQLNYKARNTGAIWTAASTLVLTPMLGIIPAAITATDYPQYENLDITDPKLLQNDVYVNAYRVEAQKKKRNKIWTHFGIGSAIWLVGTVLLYSR